MISLKLFVTAISIFISVSGITKTHQQPAENIQSVYILKHEWHVGIILKRSDTVDLLTALNNDFKNAKYIEIGWGDKDFYMAENGTVWLALKAALWPTQSVLHIAAFNQHPELKFNDDEIIKLKLNPDQYEELCSYINESFELTAEKENVKLGDGLYGNSQFYLSHEKYHLFHTCNVWAARGLKKAQVSIKPYKAITSKNVMKQLQKNN